MLAISRMSASLLHSAERELAVAHAARQSFGVTRSRVLAVGGDELGQGGEQTRLSQAIAVDSVEACFGPGLGEISQRRPSLLGVVGPRRDSRTRTRPDAHDRPSPRSAPKYRAKLARGREEQSPHLPKG